MLRDKQGTGLDAVDRQGSHHNRRHGIAGDAESHDHHQRAGDIGALDASEATIPSGIPVPNFSGRLENFFAWSYAMMLAALPPIAGRTPITMPMKVTHNRINGRHKIPAAQRDGTPSD